MKDRPQSDTTPSQHAGDGEPCYHSPPDDEWTGALKSLAAPVMPALHRPWVAGVASLLFIVVVLATTTRVSPPTALHGARPDTVGPGALEPFEFAAGSYTWLSRRVARQYEPLKRRIPPPEGFARIDVPEHSFAAWLRCLPVAPPDAPVKSGSRSVILAADSPTLAAVIALQPTQDRLLAGAALLVRLRAEYLWTESRLAALGFHFTSGDYAAWPRWAAGMRPSVNGRDVTWQQQAEPDDSRTSYCAYLETLFRYASCYSVLDDTTAINDGSIAPGDIFLHADRRRPQSVIVLDVATDRDGSVAVLLGDAGIPAQSFHVLRSPDDSPWFPLRRGSPILLSPGRDLHFNDLRRWK